MKKTKKNTKDMRTANEKLDAIIELFGSDDLLKMDGYDDCIVGIVRRFGQQPILCYSTDKVLKKLMKEGMTEEEALEFFEFNQIGAWMGDTTPCFLTE